MDKKILDFLSRVKERFPDNFTDARVLEMGSKDVNGTPRELFTDCTYIGVDVIGGDGVDFVGKAHEYKDGLFDTVISTEMLEHDEYAEMSMKNAKDRLRNGGLLVVTAAGIGRKKHYGVFPTETYYKNISREFVTDIFPEAEIEEDSGEIRFIWIK